MNHFKTLEETEVVVKSENKENTNPNDSPLNQWFRQQGACKTIPPINNANKNEKVKRTDQYTTSKLPHIETNNSNQKKRQLYNYDSSYSSIPNINDSFTSSDRSQTPKLSSFYLKCINDVIKTNQPQKLVKSYDDPREMKYVQNIPHLRYITFGSGKACNCVWQINLIKKKIRKY